ncbi:hypothetical protein MtrunA17_Chr1g0172431 [Medicago truncatula]|uniref:Uncharacterized protein n=1 Tax=Medicago truncatula TaxID=3880 RepID=A0A072VTP4_MEDTR|nr:hypothetical protein MTR_1g051365 [Medicago truncatula]RHN79031.1 hypothetical protein MtrunA17_Chr1g0172431 [Medicago truncatula]
MTQPTSPTSTILPKAIPINISSPDTSSFRCYFQFFTQISISIVGSIFQFCLSCIPTPNNGSTNLCIYLRPPHLAIDYHNFPFCKRLPLLLVVVVIAQGKDTVNGGGGGGDDSIETEYNYLEWILDLR